MSWCLSRDYFPPANISFLDANILSNKYRCVLSFWFMKFRISCIFFQVLAFVVEDAHQHSMEMCYAPTRWIHATTRWVFSLLM